ncbi:FecR family protein [Pedobacter africanus]|uniref:FecR family protein n=1 Tax=Pedobacter africanus TaxID=151894 RepID=A0A1W2E2G2_9SPHI|nr:FecR family protein [Pedobacter africanus]SMD03994.1 FecR family protein [Pedobacter africanus]
MAIINTERLKELAKKRLQGTISSEESEQLDAWYNQPVPKVIEWGSGDRNERELKSRLYRHLLQAVGLPDGAMAAHPGYKLWAPLVGVAAAMALVLFGIWFFNSGPSLEERSREIAARNDVPPPANTTTLTLANGEIIPLSNTKDGIVIGNSGLKYTDSSKVTVHHPGQELIVNTLQGSTYTLTLPDGSKIWLNTASTLKFPSTFNKLNTRTVELRGEAYFEIAKNAAKPFIVQSGRQVLRVLGTHFNVNTYDYGVDVKTTLLEGSVQVNLLQEPDQKKTLKPGEQASLSKRVLHVVKADTEAVMAWKRGDFVFVGDDLETIIHRLKNWYNVEFEYVGKKPTLNMTGRISRKAKLSKVLALIEASGKVKFKIEGRKVYVMK